MKAYLHLKQDKRKQHGKGMLTIRVSWNNQRVEFSQGSLDMKWWDQDGKRIKPGRGEEKEAINNLSRSIRAKITELEDQWYKLSHLREQFTAAEFKAFLNGSYDPVTGTQVPFLTWVADHIANFDKKPLPGQTKAGTKASKKKYAADLGILKAFAKESGEALTWENMDHNFCVKMRQWRSQKPANFFRPGYSSTTLTSEGTVNRWVKTVKGWITKARALGVHQLDHHLHPAWTVKEADVLRYALTIDELKAFCDWEVPDTPEEQGGAPRTGVKRARDLFCVQCCTGVRIGDLQQVVDQYNEDPTRSTFTIHMQKTDRTVTVPVLKMVHKIAARQDKEKGKLPNVGALSRLNKLLRKGAKLSGLFNDVRLKPVLDENGQRKMEQVPVHELVTSHAARRTYATFLINQGVDTRKVMAMTGHKVEATFNKYVNMNSQDLAMEIKQLADI